MEEDTTIRNTKIAELEAGWYQPKPAFLWTDFGLLRLFLDTAGLEQKSHNGL